MPVVRRSARVRHSARQMYDLVNDIESYPEFLGWCSGAHVDSADDAEVTASIDIGIGGVSQRFRTRNTLRPPGAGLAGHIDVSLVDGPFRHLDGGWTFEPLPDGGSEVRLDLEYELAFSPLKLVLSTVFDEIARSQVGAFVRRADRLHGSG